MYRVREYSVRMQGSDDHPYLSLERSLEVPKKEIRAPDDVVEVINAAYDASHLAEEYIWIIGLNVKGKILGISEISHGTVCFSFVSPREVFIRLLLMGATGGIFVHNHPSGDTQPSKEDLKMEKKLQDAGELIGIKLLDSIIIGRE